MTTKLKNREVGDMLTATQLLKECRSSITPQEFFAATDAMGVTTPYFPKTINHRLIKPGLGCNEPKGNKNQVVFFAGVFEALLQEVADHLDSFDSE